MTVQMTNTSINQRAVLQAQIWKIANEVRGAVDGWDFKQFVLGTLFYRFISENFTRFIEGGDKSINYVNMADDRITPQIKDDITKTKGYFIYPSQLFVNIAKNANTNPNLNTNLAEIFDAIENSANGYPSEKDIKGRLSNWRYRKVIDYKVEEGEFSEIFLLKSKQETKEEVSAGQRLKMDLYFRQVLALTGIIESNTSKDNDKTKAVELQQKAMRAIPDDIYKELSEIYE